MVKYHRRFRAVALSLLGGAGAGCHNTTLCEPASSTLGPIVTSGVSETYLAQVDKTGTDVPHLACKAETTIVTAKAVLRESEDGNCQSTGKYCLGGSAFDPRLMPLPGITLPNANSLESTSHIQMLQGEFRVVGVGKGVSIEDCSRIALRACNVGVDAYYDQQRGPRPPMLGCRMADYQNRCEPGERQPRAPLAATAAEPEISPEERLPATWIARLGDAKRRPVAIRALLHFHSDALARSNRNASDPAVKEVLDQIVQPLAKLYVEGNLERGTRALVIRFLAETRDPRAGRAFIHACHGFATGAGPDEEDVLHASAAIAATQFDEAAPSLGEAFAKVEAGTPKGAAASQNIRIAMLQLKSVAWKPILLEKIGSPMERPAPSADAEKLARYQTQIFWQQTSAELLGAFGDASATKPLLKVLMEKDKAEIAGPVLLGIVKIGASAVPVLTDVLAGRDAQLVEFAKSKTADAGGNAKSYVAAAAVALGAIGRADARGPMIQALKASDNDMNRAVIARELTALAANAEAIRAFRTGYDKVPPGTRVWPSMSAARPALLAASARFYDAEMVPWLLAEANAAQRKDDEAMGAALMSAILVMKGAHLAKVKVVVDKIGGDKEKSAFAEASDLLGRCKEDVDCYLSKLKAEDVSGGFVGLKAAHMIGMLGDARGGMEVVKLLPDLRQADVRAAAVLAVDHVVQKDATAVADALLKLAGPSGDDAFASTAAEQVAYRLRAR